MIYRLLFIITVSVVLSGCQVEVSSYLPNTGDFSAIASMPAGSTNHNPAFKGPYVNITNINYTDTFHGTTTIAELRYIMESQGDFVGGNYQIKGVITGLCSYGGAFTSYQLYVQDCTGGIYFWVSGGVSGVTSTCLGQVITCTVTAAQSYKGLKEVSAVSGVSVTPTGAPSAIYVQDLRNLAGIEDAIVIRATGTVKEVKKDSSGVQVVYFNESIPPYYSINGAYSPGDRVTMIGPLWMGNQLLMIDGYEAYVHVDTTYTSIW
ncbi:MAG: hypothetical protein HPY53_13720 [Brevinematales bacterium]|nr:hypothetical protein [Brevinematales bacterium]